MHEQQQSAPEPTRRHPVAERGRAPAPIRLLVADDNARLRMALVQLLAAIEDMHVVGAAADGAEAVAMAVSLAPDVVLMDVGMPILDGIEATRRIVAANPGVRVVILTSFRDREDEAYGAGAVGHLLKEAAPAELVRCVRGAAAA